MSRQSQHGTVNRYKVHDCRCDLCVEAFTEYRIKHQARKREKNLERKNYMHIKVACPSCSYPVEQINRSSTSMELRIVVKCTNKNCRKDFLVTTYFASLHPAMPESGCGTEAGYGRHRRRKEDPCTDCKTAHTNACRAREKAAAC